LIFFFYYCKISALEGTGLFGNFCGAKLKYSDFFIFGDNFGHLFLGAAFSFWLCGQDLRQGKGRLVAAGDTWNSAGWFFGKRDCFLFAGKNGSDLEGVLFEEIKRLKKSEDEIKKILKSLKNLEKMTSLSVQKVGVVRFNPFKEMGGDQSFAIALLDAFNNGLVISSLYAREGTRIYSKPIEAGQSKYALSQEEKEALKKAGVKLT